VSSEDRDLERAERLAREDEREKMARRLAKVEAEHDLTTQDAASLGRAMAIVDGMTDDERRNVIRHALIAVLHYRREKRVSILEEWAMSLWATIRIHGSASYKRAAVADPPDPRRPPVPVADVLAMLQDALDGAAEQDIHDLIERSSLGTPGAKALRESVSDEEVARVIKRATEIAAERDGGE
jgi:hypothetical protein